MKQVQGPEGGDTPPRLPFYNETLIYSAAGSASGRPPSAVTPFWRLPPLQKISWPKIFAPPITQLGTTLKGPPCFSCYFLSLDLLPWWMPDSCLTSFWFQSECHFTITFLTSRPFPRTPPSGLPKPLPCFHFLHFSYHYLSFSCICQFFCLLPVSTLDHNLCNGWDFACFAHCFMSTI